MKLPPDIAAAPHHVQSHYLAMIADGQQPAFAEMCSLGMPPGTKGSERAFLEGRQNGEWLGNMPKVQRDRMLAAARSAGVNPNGKVYFGGIADKRGIYDPKAWISDAHDVKRVAEERGMNVEGSVNYTASGRHTDRDRDVPIAKDILARETARERLNDPGLSMRDAREKAKARITPHWKKGR